MALAPGLFFEKRKLLYPEARHSGSTNVTPTYDTVSEEGLYKFSVKTAYIRLIFSYWLQVRIYHLNLVLEFLGRRRLRVATDLDTSTS